MINKNDEGLPIAPEERVLRDLSARLAKLIQREIPPGVGFTVMVFDFGERGFTAYMSNANREDMRRAMIEHLEKTAGRPA